jgi:cobalt transporter subunit CbtA
MTVILEYAMLGKIILSTLVAGLLAGLIMAGIQYLRLTPLIQIAESYESPETEAIAEANKPCVETMPGMKMCNDNGRPSWKPAEGWQRTISTTTASLMTGAGFAILMLGMSMLTNITITKQNGLIWGICGFCAVSLAPAIGLPPQLPGMPTIDLHSRQIWWIATILLTGAATYIWVKARNGWWQLAAIIIAIAPQVFAPIAPAKTESNLPTSLAAEFVSSSLAANLIMWLAIGFFVSLALDKYQKDIAEL